MPTEFTHNSADNLSTQLAAAAGAGELAAGAAIDAEEGDKFLHALLADQMAAAHLLTMRMAAAARLKGLFDGGEYETLALPEVPVDPLKFRDERRYTDRLKDARGKTGLSDAVLAGAGRLEGQRIVAAVQDFDFLGGSLGTAAGEAVIAAMRTAVRRETPLSSAKRRIDGMRVPARR